MLSRLKAMVVPAFVVLFALVPSFFLILSGKYLEFSDAAKYADIARNLISGDGYNTSFSFFIHPLFSGKWIPPVTPFSIAAFFQLFGVNDISVVTTSFIYFILTLIFVYLLAARLFKSNLAGALSTIAVGFNYDLANYAAKGASESPFIFEIVASLYFVILKKKWSNVAAGALLILMYFTRPQAFIYIAGIIFYWLLINFKTKKAVIYFFLVCIVGLLIDRIILSRLSGTNFLYSVLGRGSNVLSQVGGGQTPSDQLRSGALTSNFSIFDSFKKVFYNLYNFYKLLPQIVNPYLFTFFILGLFRWSKNKFVDSFKITSIFVLAVTFIVAAASIPFFRYLHPVIPIIYIIAVGTLFETVSIFISKKFSATAITSLLITLFVVGQTLGIILLDSRFVRNTHNVGEPPIYVKLSWLLKDNTNKDQVIITNLDTWGSWYGERKTIWFPLEPKQLIDTSTGKIPFDAIYLTSYLIDDQNYYMGDSWRQILENPADISFWKCDGCKVIASEFRLKGFYTIPANENYDREVAHAVLLVRK